MNLSALKPTEAPQPMRVLDPRTGRPLGTDKAPVTVSLVGRDSQEYRDAQAHFLDKLRSDATKRRATSLTTEEADANALAILAACTKGWEGIEWDGKPLAFSPSAAVQIYADLPWLRDQVDAFVGDRTNFLPS